ncbi:MAG: hypothetical protein M1608_12270 [Candidatus Omnitrophica bacterium]|nr:hypothetical protein [Candidatus Omnitrophota bacterium]
MNTSNKTIKVRLGCLLLGVCLAQASLEAGQAYVRQEDNRWTFGTEKVERIVALENGKLLLKSFRDPASGKEFIPQKAESAEFSLALGDAGSVVSGASGGWKLINTQTTSLENGVKRLDITVARDPIQVTKSYVIYPESSVIREWDTIKNISEAPVRVIDPSFLEVTLQPGDLQSLDFHWMSGGENQAGSWKLKTESLTSAKPRTFDSYEPFPVDTSSLGPFPGDGINAKILLNDKQIWPAQGWQYVPNATVRIPFDLKTEVKEGDKLVFLVNMNGGIGFDTTDFDPTIAYADGESHTASKEFSNEQGKNGWRYQYLEKGKYIDLVYYSGPNQWRKAKDNASGTPFVGVGNQHPDAGQDSARVWTAPKAGEVHLTGSVCNTGNGGSPASSNYGFRPGTSSYAPWYALYGRDSKEGVFIGWDYFGHWTSSFTTAKEGAVTARLNVAGFKQTLAPGESVSTPRSFIGVYRDDLDNAGNECLDWQYRYLWDYTRKGWFPAIRMLGYWYNGTGWGQTGVGWTGGLPDWGSTFRKVFRVADLMRYVGADVYHRDWGWWDRAGDWNGPDFRTTIDYLHKYGMGQLIYAFLYTVDAQSRVAKEHPDWLIGSTLDMSQPAVVKFMLGQLDMFVHRWGNFEWRNDSFFTAPRNGDDTPMLGQDKGFRQVLRSFLDKYPKCAFQAVNGGGNYGGYDYTRYCSSFSFSDGAVGILRNYYAALLFPPDKTSDIPDVWNPNNYDKATWRGLLCINFDMTGDTWDPAKLEGLRQLIDIYHYLENQGVVGRWVHVFRPIITGDDPTMYFERLSHDGNRGIVIPKRPAPGAVTIKPKGLNPEAKYVVTFQESDLRLKKTGAELMEQGIAFDKVPPGELIYLNLPLHPGSKLDTEPPTAPQEVEKRCGENMGYPGVEINWHPGTDNNWVSYYQVFRNGEPIDKVAKGTFYFDHSAGADLAAQYEVCTVDGAGNASGKVAANGPSAQPATVMDDAPGGPVKYEGDWSHQTGLLPAYAGTISASKEQGATVELSFTGKKVLVFTKLGANCGKAAVTIDNGDPTVIDTYSADDIWGVCIYRFESAAPGTHTLRLKVLGQHSARAKDTLVYLDGVRVE